MHSNPVYLLKISLTIATPIPFYYPEYYKSRRYHRQISSKSRKTYICVEAFTPRLICVNQIGRMELSNYKGPPVGNSKIFWITSIQGEFPSAIRIFFNLPLIRKGKETSLAAWISILYFATRFEMLFILSQAIMAINRSDEYIVQVILAAAHKVPE